MNRLILVLGMWLTLIAGPAFAISVKTYIPKNAYEYLDTVYQEQQRLFKDHPLPDYFPALIEQESCISLTHSKCWNPKSRLKTSREEGAGLGQITRAYTSAGKLRFDALAEMRRAHMSELRDLTWGNVYSRPDLQIRAIILKIKDDYAKLYEIKNPIRRSLFVDAAYNGGMGGVKQERRICGLKRGCDPQQWFGHVELIKHKSTKPIYGNRSAYDINREHVRNVFYLRMPKYNQLFKDRGYINP